MSVEIRKRILKNAGILLLCLASILPWQPALAADDIECEHWKETEWAEQRSHFAALVYPLEQQETVSQWADVLLAKFDRLYTDIQPLYGISLDLPITIRLYPDPIVYSCFNPLSPPLGIYVWMISVGTREIALNAASFQVDLSTMQNQIDYALSYEIGYLFAQQIAENKAPAGLLLGVAGYMQEPTSIKEILEKDPSLSVADTTASWRAVWEKGTGRKKASSRLAETSIVAYLVDVYGWPQFLDFLKDVRTTGSYRDSLEQIYQLDFSRLESQWKTYYQLYLNDRWQYHTLYNFDLSGHEALISAGAYVDVEQVLLQTIGFLTSSGQTWKLIEAQELLEKARAGQAASEILLKARRALLAGSYNEAIELANEAEARYRELDDERRQIEISSYRNWAQEVLNLQAEAIALLASAQTEKAQDIPAYLLELNRFEQRLIELGDAETAAQIKEEIESLTSNAMNSQNGELWQGLVVVGILFLLRMIVMIRRIPLEVKL